MQNRPVSDNSGHVTVSEADHFERQKLVDGSVLAVDVNHDGLRVGDTHQGQGLAVAGHLAAADSAEGRRDVVEKLAPLPVAFHVQAHEEGVVVCSGRKLRGGRVAADDDHVVGRVVDETVDVLVAGASDEDRHLLVDALVAECGLSGGQQKHQS